MEHEHFEDRLLVSRDDVGRRTFLKGIAAAAAGGALAGHPAHAVTTPTATNAPQAVAPAPVAKPAGPAWRQTSDKVIRIGIVGGRFGATFHWHLHPNCKVTAVCDIRPDRLEALQKTYRCDQGYKDFRTMLASAPLDAVGVFTPAPLHVWMATEAMKAGKHVISAVPAGMSLEEIHQLIETAEKTGMTYMMAETSRFRPEVMHCIELRKRGDFGTIFYSEAEYHHEGLMSLYYEDNGLPSWRYGFPPMHYPTHCLGLIVPVTGERMTEVTGIGWGDGHKVLQANSYKNPFWNTTGFFKTTGGHCCRVGVCWHIAAGGTERGQFFGDHMSFIMQRPDQSENVVYRIKKGREVSLDANGYPEGEVKREPADLPDFYPLLPPAMRVPSGHGGSHTFIAHEFVSALVEGRRPVVDVYEAADYTVPGIIAHQSALKGGETMKIPIFKKG